MDATARATWARRVRPERQGRGWTQAELARRADVTRETVGNIESGNHTPQLEKLLAVLDALELDYAERDPAIDDDLEALMVLIANLVKRLPMERRIEWAEDITEDLAARIRSAATGLSDAERAAAAIAEAEESEQTGHADEEAPGESAG